MLPLPRISLPSRESSVMLPTFTVTVEGTPPCESSLFQRSGIGKSPHVSDSGENSRPSPVVTPSTQRMPDHGALVGASSTSKLIETLSSVTSAIEALTFFGGKGGFFLPLSSGSASGSASAPSSVPPVPSSALSGLFLSKRLSGG